MNAQRPDRSKVAPWAIATMPSAELGTLVVYGPSYVDRGQNWLVTHWPAMGGQIYTPLDTPGLAVTWEDRCRPKRLKEVDRG